MVRPSLVLASVLLLVVAPVQAQTGPAPAPRRARDLGTFAFGSPWADAALLATGLSLAAVGTYALEPPATARAPLVGPPHVPPNDSAGNTSNAIVALSLGGTLALSLVVDHQDGRRGVDMLRAPLVLGEAALVTMGVVSILKNTLGECRPRAWDEASAACVGTDPGHPTEDDRRSWPSGHTAPTFAMVGATLALAVLPSGGRPRYLPVLALATVLAGATMSLRVVAGAHDWADTTSGAALGLGLGFATAATHLVRTNGPQISLAADGRQALLVVRGSL